MGAVSWRIYQWTSIFEGKRYEHDVNVLNLTRNETGSLVSETEEMYVFCIE